MSVRNTLIGASIAVLSLTALASFGRSAHAQDAAAAAPARRQQRGGGNATAPIMTAFKAIMPTADEQTKFDALIAKYTADAKEARAAGAGAETQAKVRELTTKLREDVSGLLTPEQQPKFKEELAKASQPNLMRPLDQGVMLTPEQKTKVEPIIADYQKQVLALMADTTVDRTARREKQTALATDMKGKFRAVLTPEQQTKFDALTFPPAAGGRRRAAQ